MVWKPALTPDALSARDKAVCDGFRDGETQKALAERFGITRERIGQILRQPGAAHYLIQQAGATRSLILSKTGEEILARLALGSVKLPDLIALWKAALPQESTVTVNLLVQREAARLAAEMGLDPADVLAEAEAIVKGATPSTRGEG